LIVSRAGAIGYGDGLPLCLFCKRGRTHIRNPNLDWSQTLLAQPFAMRSDLFARWFGMSPRCHSITSGYM
jgi:hypothetical protein